MESKEIEKKEKNEKLDEITKILLIIDDQIVDRERKLDELSQRVSERQNYIENKNAELALAAYKIHQQVDKIDSSQNVLEKTINLDIDAKTKLLEEKVMIQEKVSQQLEYIKNLQEELEQNVISDIADKTEEIEHKIKVIDNKINYISELVTVLTDKVDEISSNVTKVVIKANVQDDKVKELQGDNLKVFKELEDSQTRLETRNKEINAKNMNLTAEVILIGERANIAIKEVTENTRTISDEQLELFNKYDSFDIITKELVEKNTNIREEIVLQTKIQSALADQLQDLEDRNKDIQNGISSVDNLQAGLGVNQQGRSNDLLDITNSFQKLYSDLDIATGNLDKFAIKQEILKNINNQIMNGFITVKSEIEDILNDQDKVLNNTASAKEQSVEIKNLNDEIKEDLVVFRSEHSEMQSRQLELKSLNKELISEQKILQIEFSKIETDQEQFLNEQEKYLSINNKLNSDSELLRNNLATIKDTIDELASDMKAEDELEFGSNTNKRRGKVTWVRRVSSDEMLANCLTKQGAGAENLLQVLRSGEYRLPGGWPSRG